MRGVLREGFCGGGVVRGVLRGLIVQCCAALLVGCLPHTASPLVHTQKQEEGQDDDEEEEEVDPDMMALMGFGGFK